MLNEFINFETISRKEWQRLHKEDNAPLTSEELDSIRSLNDKIDVQEVSDIYLPLINLIRIYQKTANDLTFSKSIFLQKSQTNRPIYYWGIWFSCCWQIHYQSFASTLVAAYLSPI